MWSDFWPTLHTMPNCRLNLKRDFPTSLVLPNGTWQIFGGCCGDALTTSG